MDGKYFVCEIHKQNFETIDALKLHVKQHHSIDLRCKVCDKSFESEFQFERHKNLHKPTQMTNRNPNPNASNVLTKSPPSHPKPQSQDPTIPATSLMTAFQCHICAKFYSGDIKLSQHLLSHLEDRPLLFSPSTTEENTPVIKTENILDASAEIETSNQDVKPKVDNEDFLYNSGQSVSRPNSEHNFSNHEDEDYKPDDDLDSSDEDEHYKIDEDFVSSGNEEDYGNETDSSGCLMADGNLKRNKKKSVTFPKTCDFRCYFCHKSWLTWNDLERHIWSHTKEQLIKCDLCENYYYDQQHLDKHRVVHTAKKLVKRKRKIRSRSANHTCKMCRKSFHTDMDLKRHLVYHTGERPFKCQLCKNSFQEARTLELHMLTHSDQRSHSCDQCKKAYKRPADLRRHVETAHSNRTPFKCEVCFRGFKRKDLRNLHMKLHQSQGPVLTKTLPDDLLRPYNCNQCQKSYTSLSCLRGHTETVHSKERQFKCKFCFKDYNHQTSYNRHLKQHQK